MNSNTRDGWDSRHPEVERIRKMGRWRRNRYRKRLVKWLEKNPPNGWLGRDADRLMVEGRIEWLDAGCPDRKRR